MKRLVSTKNMPHEEWLRWRKKGLGGSDVGAICGLNPYRTAMQVYYDKTADEIEDFDNEAMRQGRELEEYVAQRFMEATGKKVRRANYMFVDEMNPFMLADVDRLVVGENAGLECKTCSPYSAEKWKDGKIPLYYLLQCYHYISVCNADHWYIAVLIYGQQFIYHKIERDGEIITNLIDIERYFWEEHVVKNILPSPDGSKLADSVIAEYYQKSENKVIALTGFDEKLQRREELLELMEKLETEKNQIEQELKLYMGEAEMAQNDKFYISWKPVISNRIDTKLLKTEQPEIYHKYQKKSQSRRFVVKAA